MEYVSVSRGVFASKGKSGIGRKKKKPNVPVFLNEPWYLAYKEAWKSINETASKANTIKFNNLLTDLLSFVVKVNDSPWDDLCHEIPTAILLTGVNIPDHSLLFQVTVSKIRNLTPYIALVSSRNSTNIKTLTEDVIYQLINSVPNDEDAQKTIKSRCNFRTLRAWREEMEEDVPLVIIIEDFEGFSASVLHDFIIILSSYRNIAKFVLVFGVATTLHAVRRSLSYDVTSKLKIQVFHMQKQIDNFSDIIKKITLKSDVPFMLTGNVFPSLVEIFLKYDFSINTFLQSYKMCMLQHFYKNNMFTLCCPRQHLQKAINNLSTKELERVIKRISVGNKHMTQKCLRDSIEKFHTYVRNFLVILQCFQKLIIDLPDNTIENKFYYIYNLAVSTNFTESIIYKNSIKILNILAKHNFLTRLENILSMVIEHGVLLPESIAEQLKCHIHKIKSSNTEILNPVNKHLGQFKTRSDFKNTLLEQSQIKLQSEFKKAQTAAINFLDQEIFSVYLKLPSDSIAYEIFCYNNDQVLCHIRAPLKAVIELGLEDPSEYLKCSCCVLEDEMPPPPTLPDLSIIYKLHSEYRKMINMYDWLQAFLTIIKMDRNDDNQDMDPQLEARFTRAVSELQFLGFIKTTRRKTDHVNKLTI